MKTSANRILSLLLCLFILVSTLAGITVSAAGSTINSGKRHELCTSLSSQAKAYYTGSNTWENLSALSGTDTTSSVAAIGSPLFNSLQKLMKGTLTKTVSYDSLTSYWKETDRQSGGSDAVLFYSDVQSGSYNREHVWPKSLGNFYKSGAGSDLHHLRPTNSTINSTRSHYTFGDVKAHGITHSTKDYNGKTVLWYNASYSQNDCLGLVEVNDNIKGDIARILLYVYTTYGNSTENTNLFTKAASSGSGNNANTGDKIIESLDTLLEWMEMDPVDTWEMSRNDCVQNIQGNRNAFIDYPEFAWLLFGRDVPAGYDTPSGNGGHATTYTVTPAANSNGSVTISGSVITAVPNTGYAATGYTVTPEGAAAVSQNGNTFTVSNVKQNCTVTILFTEVACVHNYTNVVTAPTCTEQGYITHTCTLCGDTYVDTYTDALGHSWDEGKVTTPPTATSTGIKTFTCTRCNAAKTEIIPATGDTSCKHQNVSSEHKDATCTENGYDRTVCKDCGTVISEAVIKALGHNYQDTVIAPACTEKGYTLHTCTRCGDSYKDSDTAALGHDFGPWSVSLAATCTQSGKESRTCARCGVTETKNIPAIGHDYHNGICIHCGQKDPNYKPDSIHCDGGKNCPSRIFNDLKLKTWYHDSVDYVLASGLMNGVSDWEFNPEGTLTRGMLVTILYRLEGCPDVKSLEDMPFDDVTYGAWYTEAIVWAASEGIVNGISETSFAPNAPVTREQIAAIFYRYAGSEKVSGTLLNFVDAFAVSEYAYDPMLWAVNEGIITGSYDRLSPRDNATRAQIAAVLYRYLTK